ncbi:MAG: sulfur carrier protein ThiS [Planctomycetota bacterium]
MNDGVPQVEVILNGKSCRIPAGLTVAELLRHHRFPPAAVAVEINRKIVPRAAHETTAVSKNDVIEVVSFVGGG